MASRELHNIEENVESFALPSPPVIDLPEEFLIRGELVHRLSASEIDIYLLLRNKAKRLSEIADLVGLGRTQTYCLLTSLQRKGFVKVIEGSPVRFIGLKYEGMIN